MACGGVIASVLAGCGTASGPAGPRPPGGNRTQVARVTANERARAGSYARRLLRALELPGTARRMPWPRLQPLSLMPLLPSHLGTTVVRREMLRVTWGIAKIDHFLSTHVPARMTLGDSGQSGNARSPAPTAYEVNYIPRDLPSGIFAATVATAVVSAPGGGSLLRADAQVTWSPPRSAAERIDPVRYRAVTVTAPSRPTPPARLVTRTFAERSVVARLAGLVNLLPVMPDMVINCPAMFPGVVYRLAFIPAAARWPRIVVTMPGCMSAGVRVAGKPQPVLDYGGSAILGVIRGLMKGGAIS